jgi:hypothetical protein
MNLFDVINNINAGKAQFHWTDEVSKNYVPYMINRGMSQFPDTIMYANEMNIRNNVDTDQQFQYLYHSVKPKKMRISKWAKPEKDAEVLVIAEYFGCNVQLARMYSNMLTDDQKKLICDKMFKGGN